MLIQIAITSVLTGLPCLAAADYAACYVLYYRIYLADYCDECGHKKTANVFAVIFVLCSLVLWGTLIAAAWS